MDQLTNSGTMTQEKECNLRPNEPTSDICGTTEFDCLKFFNALNISYSSNRRGDFGAPVVNNLNES